MPAASRDGFTAQKMTILFSLFKTINYEIVECVKGVIVTIARNFVGCE
jgi:hypothetical protein